MKARFRYAMLRLGPVLVFGLMAVQSLSAEAPVNNQFAITAISVQGTNLVLGASIPAGLGQVSLEMRPTLQAPWKTMELSPAAMAGGELTFTISKPAKMQFFRLRAAAPVEGAAGTEAVSEELSYVTIAPLGTGPRDGSMEPEAVFHFKGLVDGSDHIVITRQGALWQHSHWDWPQGAVIVNGTQWDPCQKNYLTAAGTAKFLPETFSLDSVRLEVIKARDVVALERTNDALIVHLDDTPLGADEYEFKVRFRTASQVRVGTAVSPAATLKIAAEIDGSDCLKITATEATWEHKHWDWPRSVMLNGVPWSLQQTNVLRNEGTSRFLPSGVDFSTARIVGRKGRDLATMRAEKDVLCVWFADNPNGSDWYEIEIALVR